MKAKLMALLKTKQEARTAKVAMVDKSNDVAELRSLQSEVEAIDVEIRSIETMIAEIKDDQNERTAAVNSEIPGIVKASNVEVRTDGSNDMEYRKAFQQFVTSGTPIPVEMRANATTKTSDIGSAIPTVLVDRIVETMESTGMILPLVTKTSFAAGVSIPVSSIKPVATWVAEGATSDRQKKTTTAI